MYLATIPIKNRKVDCLPHGTTIGLLVSASSIAVHRKSQSQDCGQYWLQGLEAPQENNFSLKGKYSP